MRGRVQVEQELVGRQVGKVGAQFWTCLLDIQMELSCRRQMCDLEMRTSGA